MASSAARMAKTRSMPPGIQLQLQPAELELLVSLASDQLFRREFIDPKMPGFKTDAGQLHKAKEIVGRLRAALEGDAKRALTRVAGTRVAGWKGGK